MVQLIEWSLPTHQSRIWQEVHAQRARDLWGLWNRGYPVGELLAHFPHPNTKRKSYMTVYNTLPAPNITHPEAIKTCFFRYLIEYERVRNHPLLDGWFTVDWAAAGDGPAHHFALPRIVFIPTSNESSGFAIGDEHEAIRAAWALIRTELELPDLPVTEANKNGRQALVDWIVKELGPAYFPASKKQAKQWKGKISLLVGKSTVGDQFYLLQAQQEHEKAQTKFTLLELIGSSDTNLHILLRHPNKDDITALESFPYIPIGALDTLKTLDKMNRFHIEQTWFSLITLMTERSTGRVHANLCYSLASELMEGFSTVARVVLHEKTKTTATYKFVTDFRSEIWGVVDHPNALEFADMAFEENDGEVAINDVYDPLTWKKSHQYLVAKIQSADPHTLSIQKTEFSKDKAWPKEGFLKVSNWGNRSIADRKKMLINRAGDLRVIEERMQSEDEDSIVWLHRHNILTKNLEFGPKWRLESRGPFQLIQGPPGTGKTWTSTRLIEDILGYNSAARILVCAKEHLALDHLVDAIKSSFEASEVNIARIASSVHHGLTDEDDTWIHHSQDYWKTIAEAQDSSLSELVLNPDESAKVWTYGAYLNECQIICTTTTDLFLLDNLRKDHPLVFDYCIVEEAGKAYISELIGAIAMSRTWLLVGDQMQLPPYQLQQTRSHYHSILSLVENEENVQVKRDYDYVRKMLIDLKFVLRWGVLADLNTDDYMDRYMDSSFEPFKNYYALLENHDATHFLPEQRRMFETLSQLISSVFYNTTFEWKKPNQIDDSKLPSFFKTQGRLILVDTPHSSKKKKWKETLNHRHSRQNEEEAKVVIQLLDRLEDHHDVVVLTPYNGQVDLIKNMMGNKYPTVKVHTTDGYQGKEADFVVLSLVRNNVLTGRRRWGFVTDPHRLNVALSRAREGLIVVTSAQQITESEMVDGANHLQMVLDYIQNHGKIISSNQLGRDT